MDKPTKKPRAYFEKPKLSKPEKCRMCGKGGDIFSSRLNQIGKRYYNLDCNTCRGKARSTFMKRLRTTDPERYYQLRRNTQLKRYYKIGLPEYMKMLEEQKGCCAICGKYEGTRAMPLDHNHVTKTNRAILCHWCNKGLGQFFDNADTLRKAADYLDKWSK